MVDWGSQIADLLPGKIGIIIFVVGACIYNLVGKHLEAIGTILVDIRKDINEIKVLVSGIESARPPTKRPWPYDDDYPIA